MTGEGSTLSHLFLERVTGGVSQKMDVSDDRPGIPAIRAGTACVRIPTYITITAVRPHSGCPLGYLGPSGQAPEGAGDSSDEHRKSLESPCGFASVIALPLVDLVALFLATVLLPIETYLLYAYCVLVVRAWTYEYGLNQMMSGVKSLLYDSLHDICCTHYTCASGALCMIHSSIIHLLCVLAPFSR